MTSELCVHGDECAYTSSNRKRQLMSVTRKRLKLQIITYSTNTGTEHMLK